MSGPLEYGATLLEGQHRAEFLVSEAEGFRSRDVITVTNSSTTAQLVLPAGLVMALTTVPVGGVPGAGVPYAGSATAGTAAGVLYANVVLAPSASGKVTVVLRDAEVNASELKYDASITTAAQQQTVLAALAATGVVAR